MLGTSCLLEFLTSTQASISLSLLLSHTEGETTEENVAWENHKAQLICEVVPTAQGFYCPLPWRAVTKKIKAHRSELSAGFDAC